MNEAQNKKKKLLGILRASASNKATPFKMPVAAMKLHVIVNFSSIGAVASCETFLNVNTKENNSYGLLVDFDSKENQTCASKLFDENNKLIDEYTTKLNHLKVNNKLIINPL